VGGSSSSIEKVCCLDEFGVRFSYVGAHPDEFGQNFGPMYVP
jgi:hypothetical protein